MGRLFWEISSFMQKTWRSSTISRYSPCCPLPLPLYRISSSCSRFLLYSFFQSVLENIAVQDGTSEAAGEKAQQQRWPGGFFQLERLPCPQVRGGQLSQSHSTWGKGLYFGRNRIFISPPPSLGNQYFSPLRQHDFCAPLVQWWAKWRLSTFDLDPSGEGHGVQEQICVILIPQLAMNRFLPLWPHRFPHFEYIHLGGEGVGGLWY